METRIRAALRDSGQAGTSLVEVMVAGTILAMSITATATMLKAGNELMYKKNLEREARRLAFSALEEPAYQFFPGYNSMPASVTRNETLDQYDRPISAQVVITADPEVLSPEHLTTKEYWGPYNSTYWRRVKAKVTWTVEGVQDSVVAVKLVGEAK